MVITLLSWGSGGQQVLKDLGTPNMYLERSEHKVITKIQRWTMTKETQII